jgi:elongation factor P hydroxylase
MILLSGFVSTSSLKTLQLSHYRCASMLGCEQIKAIFEHEFRRSHNIVLIGGGAEPVYLPSVQGLPNRLCYTRDYPASALHEIAHWCLARDEQLALRDWGLWYVPDGRNARQQQHFQQVEARVQALEWILSVAAGRPFRESSDNLGGETTDDLSFKEAIHEYVQKFCESGLPERAARLWRAFSTANGTALELSPGFFRRSALDELVKTAC